MNKSDKDKNIVRRSIDNSVDFKYICIKKEYFDVNMIYLNYTNLKKRNYIEIIYKSPSIYLDGLFFKTPPIKLSHIYISRNIKQPYNITLKVSLDNSLDNDFINMIRLIDNYISNYITKYAKEITREMNTTIENANNCIEMYKYDNILKIYKNHNELHLKSYLDNTTINNLQYGYGNDNLNTRYIFTFNISNIYFGRSSLIPLVKCNQCETIQLNN